MSKYKFAVDRVEPECGDGVGHKWYLVYTDTSCNSLVEACVDCAWVKISELKGEEHLMKYYQKFWR